LPLWDRNQGTIQQANADLNRSVAEVNRVELSLRQRLAGVFSHYRTARETTQIYRDESIPKAREAYEVQLGMYKQRRTAWPEVVALKGGWLMAQAEYTQHLLDLRKAEVAIVGLLLIDGLTEPPVPTPAGHIDATPKPR